MHCPECHHSNPDQAKFCMECGAKLEGVCSQCGGTLPPGAKFCMECGTRVGEAPPRTVPKLEDMEDRLYIPEPLRQKMGAAQVAMEGENRLVTALFADISGFTSMSQELTPEAVVEKVNACFRVVIDTVYRYEGNINKFMGDCVLAIFGAPLVHENDPERAILAALGMRETVGELELEVSIGVNTGMMYFGPIGTEHHLEVSAYGHDINLAQRLQSAACPGQIVVGAGTYRSTRRMFAFRALEPLTLRGIDGSVSAYEVLGVREHPEKVRGIEGLRARMIGRERAIGELREATEEWLGGGGQMVSVIGEAGIGKSRLVSELKTYLETRVQATGGEEAVVCLEGRCVSIGQPISYWPFVDILRLYFGFSEVDRERDVAQKVTQGVTELFPGREEEFLPYLGNVLSIQFGNALDERLQFATPEQIRHHTLMRLRDLFEGLARKRPVLLILEDLHWSDDLSLDLLSLLMDSLTTTRLMVVCVYRPEREHRVGQLSTLAQRKCVERYTEIVLRELSPRESRRLVEELLAIEDLPERVKERILRRSEGNPFFIEEVIRSLIDRDLVYRDGERWKAREEISEMDVPHTIQSVVLARVDRLQAEARYVLQCASVIGRLFRYRLLGHLTRYEEDLQGYLDELEGRELVYEEHTVPELEYAFKHVLTQEATYGSILERRRRAFHRQVAQGIEQLYRERSEEYYEDLAYHYARSDDRDKAIEYLLKAGKKATRRFANEEAIGYLNQGLAVLGALPDTPERAQQELAFQVALGPPLLAGRGLAAPETDRALTRARALCQQLGDTRHLFPVMVLLATVYAARMEHQRVCEAAQELLCIAEAAEDPLRMAMAHKMLGISLLHMGAFPLAREHLEQGLSRYDREQRDTVRLVYGEDFEVSALAWMSSDLWYLGYPDQALKWSQDAVALASQVAHPYTLCFAHIIGGSVRLLSGRIQAAREHAEAATQLAAKEGMTDMLTLAGVNLSRAHIDGGDVEQGMAELHRMAAALGAEGVWINRTFHLACLAKGYGKVGKPAEGLSALSEALDLVEKADERFWEAEIYRLRGELLQMQGGAEDEVEACFGKAIEVARTQQARSWELRAAMSMSRLWQRQGKREEARHLLAEVYDGFTEGWDTADLREAKALLEEFSGP